MKLMRRYFRGSVRHGIKWEEKTKNELSVAAKEITDEGKEYLSAAADSSPEVKEIVETFTSPPEDIQKLSGVRDFYVGVPYGMKLLCVLCG